MLTPDFLFTVANQLAFGSWLLLLVAPNWRWTRALVLRGTVPLLLAGAYVILIGYQTLAHPAAGAGFGSLGQVAALFREPWALLAGWVHYLCFDLAIGAWEARDAKRRGVPHLALIPCLAATFMLGPLGLLLYSGVRRFYRPVAAPVPLI
ncbi:ABA4-like family protein [Hymenobacter humi]|uniref:ABA4-like family protein n=1 Tax=Hymenobacter humi TaxID=1411620 RepID=A0ABW2U7S2_9BACT